MAIAVKRGNWIILPPTTYTSDAVSYTAYCSEGFEGDSVTVEIEAGLYTSIYNKEAANRKAMAAARSQAESQLVCTPVGGGLLTDPLILTDNFILTDSSELLLTDNYTLQDSSILTDN